MSRASDITDESARLDRIFRDKARAEIDAAEQLGAEAPVVRSSGDEFAEVLLVKGEPGQADFESALALSGPDGDAAGKALDALGLPSARFAFCTRHPGLSEDERRRRILALVEVVDPSTVIALDPLAAHDLAEALESGPLASGAIVIWRGRRMLAVDGLEASLTDETLKRRVWQQLKALAAPDVPQT